MKKLLEVRYYKSRLWKVSKYMIPLGNKPFNGQGFRFIKFYEKREYVGDPWSVVSFADQELFGARGYRKELVKYDCG